jgi:aldose 1-epimerase
MVKTVRSVSLIVVALALVPLIDATGGADATPAAGKDAARKTAASRTGPAPAAIVKTNFGKSDGKDVHLYTLTNKNGLVLKVMTYGGIVTELHLPDRAGKMADVVLGFDNLEAYLKGHPHFGAITGRVANRIKAAQFTLDGATYKLAANNGPDHLHGGVKGWDKLVWQAEASETPSGPSLKLSNTSPDGDEGYPGAVNATVTYTLTNNNEFRVDMTATTDKATLVNLAHHSYFNLGGNEGGDVLGHELMINADRYTPGVPIIPDGKIKPVAGTPFDFKNAKTIAKDLNAIGNKPIGYDHNYVVNGDPGAMRIVARAKDPRSGRVMILEADQPGVQFYTGNYLDGSTTGKGMKHVQHGGFCLETQKFPNAINIPEWRDQDVLRPGQTYSHRMVYKFSTE